MRSVKDAEHRKKMSTKQQYQPLDEKGLAEIQRVYDKGLDSIVSHIIKHRPRLAPYKKRVKRALDALFESPENRINERRWNGRWRR